MIKTDTVDRKILALLSENARTSNADIARAVGMAPSAVLERIRKLESRGVIRGYVAEIAPEAVGLGLLAYVLVQTAERAGEAVTGDALAAVPEVQEVHHVAGEDCYLTKVRVATTADLGRLLRISFGAIPTVTSTRSVVVLETVKETAGLTITAESFAEEAS